jgi:hypothetical protein
MSLLLDDGHPHFTYAKLLAVRPWIRHCMGIIYMHYRYETGYKGPVPKAQLFYLRRYAVNLLRTEFCNALPFDDHTKEAMRYVH